MAEVEVVDQVRKTRALREAKERQEQVLAPVARVDPLAVVQVDPLQVVVLQAPIRLDQDQGVGEQNQMREHKYGKSSPTCI